MTDTVLVIAWLVLAHLVADFVLQNDWIAINKGGGGRTGWAALGTHGFHVGLCLVPVVFAFGVPGIVYIALVVITHMLVDRWKVRATRRAASKETRQGTVTRTPRVARAVRLTRRARRLLTKTTGPTPSRV
jgi:uncharacterized membrane protein